MNRVVVPILSAFLIVFFTTLVGNVLAQVSPYALSPKWHFGNKAGLNFTSGSVAFLSGGQTDWRAYESTSTICDPNKNVVFYTDGYNLYDQNHVFIQNLNGSTTSTQAAIIVPDPASRANRFYLFTANADFGGGIYRPGSSWNMGIHWYHIQKTATTISIITGPVKIADNDQVTEAISSSTDGNGNYWIIAHQGGNYTPAGNQFWAWPVTSSGVGAKVTSSIAGTTGNAVYQSTIKINKCQNRLAAVFNVGYLEVYDWDQSTGKVTNLLRRVTAPGTPDLYGCEFSPDGNIVYFTSLNGNRMYQLDVSTGVILNPGWSSSNNDNRMGSLQLGPDNKIYVANGNNGNVPTYIGVVSNPDVSGLGCNYSSTGYVLNAGPGVPSYTWGLSNIAWTNPDSLKINVNNCPGTFSYDFKTYFQDNITVSAASEEWNFGSGGGFEAGLGSTPTHSYAIDGSYTIQLRLKDQTCNKTWTATKNITTTCALPVRWIYINAEKENTKNKITWSTDMEINNSYFIVEKSADGKNFEAIGNVEGNGTYLNTARFEFYDLKPLNTTSYYRITQVDFNGTKSTSPIVAVDRENIVWSIVPNPSTKEFNLMIHGIEDGTITIYNAIGQELLSRSIYPELTFGDDFKKGVYVVKLVTNKETLYTKIIKE